MVEVLSIISLIMTGIATLISVVIVYNRCLILKKMNSTDNELLESDVIPHELQKEKKEELQNTDEVVKQIINELNIIKEALDKMNKQSDKLDLVMKSDITKAIVIWNMYSWTKKEDEEIINQLSKNLDELGTSLQNNKKKMSYRILSIYSKLNNRRENLSIAELEAKWIINFLQNNKPQE